MESLDSFKRGSLPLLKIVLVVVQVVVLANVSSEYDDETKGERPRPRPSSIFIGRGDLKRLWRTFMKTA